MERARLPIDPPSQASLVVATSMMGRKGLRQTGQEQTADNDRGASARPQPIDPAIEGKPLDCADQDQAAQRGERSIDEDQDQEVPAVQGSDFAHPDPNRQQHGERQQAQGCLVRIEKLATAANEPDQSQHQKDGAQRSRHFMEV